MSFLNVYLKKDYRTPGDNVIKNFYIPLLKESKLYKRSVGFFSSSSLVELSYGISELIKNDGKIQLIVSPVISDDDLKAINLGYKNRVDVETEALLNGITEPQDYYEEERLNMLANLIAMGKLDIKIAYSVNNQNKLGLYHEKQGLFYDKEGNIVTFSGSMNETKTAFNDNYESFDVFTSWDDLDRVEGKEKYFDQLWNNVDLNARVFDFPVAPIDKILSYKKDKVNWQIDVEEELSKMSADENFTTNIPRIPFGKKLFPYQERAIDEWANNNYIGIYDMATGTGKTYTGLASICKLYEKCDGKLAVFIACPQIHLVNQWVEDIIGFNMLPIIGYGGSPQKDFKQRLKKAVLDFNLGVKDFFCFISTNATYSSPEIQAEISKLKGNVLLMVDEAHNFGSPTLLRTLDDRFKYRLALSATFERHGDEEGTETLTNYFQKKCIIYTLEEAIEGKFLTKYRYYPIIVTLTDEELEKYHAISREISKCIIKKNGKNKLNDYGEKLVRARARIIAGAYNKIETLAHYIKPYKDDNYILVYCGSARVDEQDENGEDIKQIDVITRMLGNQFDMKVHRFTSREDPKTRAIIKEKFADGKSLQALVAIKCLDEGINIPAIKTAFILASTTNPKEYIQRRGRVLRKMKGKDFAEIYDFITLPRRLEDVSGLTDDEIRSEKRLVKNELNRLTEFGRIAMNSMESHKMIEEIKETYRLLDNDDDIIEMEDGSYE